MPIFRTINKDVFDYGLALTKLSAAGVPVAIRNTLNSAAFDVKQVTMPYETDKDFIKRRPTFFKATSSVNPASGLDTSNMRAEVGFIAPGNIKESGHATKDLEEQEYGGDIDKRAFIATKQGRTAAGNVRDPLTMARIKKHIVDANKERGKNSAEKFIRAAVKMGYGGNGVGGFVIGTGRDQRGNRLLLKIVSIKRIKETTGGSDGIVARKGDTVVRTVPVYTVKAHRKAHVKATHFMEDAATESAAKMNETFKEEAEKFFMRLQMRRAFPAIKP